MTQFQHNLLNEDQIKILQCIKDGISSQKDISQTLGIENYLVNYYLESLEKDEFIRCHKESSSGNREYDRIWLKNKGKVALDNTNNLIKETNMAENRIINTHNYSENIGIRNMNRGEIKEGVKIAGIINEADSENLEIAVKEVKEILDQLSKTYPVEKTTDKMISTWTKINVTVK